MGVGERRTRGYESPNGVEALLGLARRWGRSRPQSTSVDRNPMTLFTEVRIDILKPNRKREGTEIGHEP